MHYFFTGSITCQATPEFTKLTKQICDNYFEILSFHATKDGFNIKLPVTKETEEAKLKQINLWIHPLFLDFLQYLHRYTNITLLNLNFDTHLADDFHKTKGKIFLQNGDLYCETVTLKDTETVALSQKELSSLIRKKEFTSIQTSSHDPERLLKMFKHKILMFCLFKGWFSRFISYSLFRDAPYEHYRFYLKKAIIDIEDDRKSITRKECVPNVRLFSNIFGMKQFFTSDIIDFTDKRKIIRRNTEEYPLLSFFASYKIAEIDKTKDQTVILENGEKASVCSQCKFRIRQTTGSGCDPCQPNIIPKRKGEKDVKSYREMES